MATPHLALDRQAVSTPEHCAVVAVDGARSYRWLSTAADRVARALAQRDGGGERFGHVGVVFRPTAGFVAAVLGCLKAGTFFTVLEDAAGDADLPAMVTAVLDVGLVGEVAAGTVDISAAYPRQSRAHVPTTDQPQPPTRRISVLRTSSSRPRIGAFDAGDWAVDRFGLGDRCRFAVLAFSPDLLVSALSSAFQAGATVLLPELRPTGDIAALRAWLRTSAVTVLYLTAPILRVLGPQELPTLSHLFIKSSGDLMPHDLEAARRLAPNARVATLYRLDVDGRPACVYEAPPDNPISLPTAYAPLGTATSTTGLRVLDGSGRPATVGEPGEIWAADGPTGDRGFRHHDGSLHFAGRVGTDSWPDRGTIVTALRQFPGVRAALVRDHRTPEGRAALIGYVEGPEPCAGTAALRGFLAARLSRDQVPEHLFVLSELARTIYGDYDEGALPAPESLTASLHGPYVAPGTPTERHLAAILTELLAIGRIGIHESFFDLGAVSILAPRLIARVSKELAVDLDLRQIYERPTVEGLAQVIAARPDS